MYFLTVLLAAGWLFFFRGECVYSYRFRANNARHFHFRSRFFEKHLV